MEFLVIRKTLLTSAALLLSFSVLAEDDIELDSWGVRAAVATLDCPNGCTVYNRLQDGGINEDTASIAHSTNEGTGEAYADLSGSGFTPVLKAKSSSTGTDNRSSAGAVGIQKYTYVGTEPKTFTFDLHLHGVVTGTPGDAGIRADVAVIRGDIVWNSDMATLVYELVPYSDVLAYQSLYIRAGLEENTSTTVSFEVQPGEEFFVRADLVASSDDGASADAFNTFTITIDDPAGLIAESNPEPQPEPQPEPELTHEDVVKYLWEYAYEDGTFKRYERFAIFHISKFLGLSLADIRRLKEEVIAEAADSNL